MRFPFVLPSLALIALAPAWSADRAVPSSGSAAAGPDAAEWDSKWNLFSWRGKSSTDITSKLNQEYARFRGATWQGYPGGNATERFIHDYPGNSNLLYCRWDGGAHGRVVIESVCYAMMFAVQMNDRDTFDRLWRYTKMYHQLGKRSDSSGGRAFFSWQIHLKADGTVDLGQRGTVRQRPMANNGSRRRCTWLLGDGAIPATSITNRRRTISPSACCT